jgi:MFS family permease
MLAGLGLTALPGIAYGVIDVLAPLRLARLGASATVIAATFLVAAAFEAAGSPVTGRLTDRFGVARPVAVLLAVGCLAGIAFALPASALSLMAVIVIFTPFLAALYTPAAALTSASSARLGLNQGLGFGLGNLAWAGGQAIASSATGALAQATSDAVPYLLVSAACAVSLGLLLMPRSSRGRAFAQRGDTEQDGDTPHRAG